MLLSAKSSALEFRESINQCSLFVIQTTNVRRRESSGTCLVLLQISNIYIGPKTMAPSRIEPAPLLRRRTGTLCNNHSFIMTHFMMNLRHIRCVNNNNTKLRHYDSVTTITQHNDNYDNYTYTTRKYMTKLDVDNKHR